MCVVAIYAIKDGCSQNYYIIYTKLYKNIFINSGEYSDNSLFPVAAKWKINVVWQWNNMTERFCDLMYMFV